MGLINRRTVYILTAVMVIAMTSLASYYAVINYNCKNDNSKSYCNSQEKIKTMNSTGSSTPLEVTGTSSDITLPSNNPVDNNQTNTQQSTPNGVPILDSGFLSSFEANIGGDPNTPPQN